MSIKNTLTEQVAAQIGSQGPYSRLNVTSTGSGEYVAVAHNGRASVKDRVTAFDSRCSVRRVASGSCT